MSKPIVTTLLLIALALIGVGLFLHSSRPPIPAAEVAAISESASPTQPAALSEQAPVLHANRYHDTAHKFSFTVPTGFNAVPTRPAKDQVLIGVEPQSSGKREGFQIYISSYDGPEQITAERIHQDLPALLIQNPKTTTLAGLKALVFNSKDSDIGNTYEVWFIHDGSLYQIMTYSSFRDELDHILQTWTFQ